MAQKRRVLFVGEASFTATGFGTYYQELLKRLYQMGDLELAEIGCYVSETDPRCRSVPWKFYPVVPHPDDEEGNRIYNNDVLAQFGKVKFDEACLDFKPDIVCVRPTCRITYFDAKKNCRKTKYAYNVQVGDMVLTHNNRYMPVTEVMRRENDTKTLAKIFIESGGSVSATREHPILASKVPSFGIAKWTPMIDIEVGDYVFYPLENGEYEVNRVSHKKLTGYIGHVHNFSVAEDNSYVADGIIVHNCDIRDEWMSAHILFSPLRKNFFYNWLLTIDGVPQREKWLDEYRQVDNCLTYSKWAMNDVMKTSARPGTNMVTIASPGVDLDVFKPPVDKKEHKAKLGIHPESLIVGCLAKDTPVLMADWSWKPIQDIIVGEKVIDAEGNEQVVEATHIFEPNKPIIDIEVIGEPEPITLTHDHEILAVKRIDVSKEKQGDRKLYTIHKPGTKEWQEEKHGKLWNPEFVEPQELAKGDFWAFKIPNKINDIEFLVRSEWVEHPKTSNHKLPEKIYLTEGFLKFIGLYLANGSIHDSKDCEHHSIEISTNTKNINLIKSVVDDIKLQFSLEVHVRAIGNETQLAIHNVSLGRLIYKLCGKHAHQKKLHPLFNYLHPTKQLSIVEGYQNGDGHLDETGRNHSVSVNRDLLVWMRLALLRNGVVSHLYKRNMEKAQCYANARQQWRLCVKLNKKKFDQFIYNGYLYSPIKSVEPSEYNDQLYDLTIANSHSYVSFLKGLHNTVMRCQPRKLYYDLIEAFGKWVYKNKSKGHLDLVNKTFLYLHTSYPDVGYDIGRAVQEFRVGNRVLMTYLCQACGSAFPAFFAGALTSCRNCHKMSAMTPNAMHGVPRNVLADIMKSFDMYVQYSTAEGYAMPLADSLACGVPVAALDHSAMKDHLESPHAMPIRVGRYFYEPCNQTEQKRALPDNDDFIQKMDIYLRKSYEQRMKMSKEIRDWTVELVDTYGSDKKFPRSSWDRTAEIWKNVLLSMPIHNRNATWDDPSSKLHIPQMLDVSKMNNKEFVNWVLVEIYNRPELVDTYYASEWITALNMGYRNDFNRKIPTDRNSVVQHFMELNNQYNLWENRRLNNLQNIGKQEVFDVL